MKSHTQIDERALELAKRIVACIDSDPTRAGLEKARATCARWHRILPEFERRNVDEWAAILEQPWSGIRKTLLDPGEEGKRLRQSSPFCGVISNDERWRIMREFRDRDSLEDELEADLADRLRELLPLV